MRVGQPTIGPAIGQWRVTMPLFTRAGGGDQVQYLFERRRPPTLPRDRTALEHAFFQANLWDEGKVAAGAVAKLGLRQRGWRQPWSRLRRVPWFDEVMITDAKVSAARENIEGESLTLGLALGLLMAGARARARHVIATGDLTGGIGEGGHRVRPIGGIAIKLAQIAQSWTRQSTRVLFFVPVQNRDGDPLPDKASVRAEFAQEIQWLDALNIELVPVLSLQEAAERLGITSLAADWRDTASAAAIGLLLLVGIGVGGFFWWHERPIELAWHQTPGATNPPAGRAPFMRSNATGFKQMHPMKLLHGSGEQAAELGQQVGVCVDLPKDGDSDYYLTAVYATDRLTEDTLPAIDAYPRPVKPGDKICFERPIGTICDVSAIGIVAERWPAVGADLQDVLRTALLPKVKITPQRGGLDLIKNLLQSKFPGRVLFDSFDVVREGGESCGTE